MNGGVGGLRLTDRERLFLPLGVLLFACLAYLAPPVLFQGQDFVLLHLFYRRYAADALLAGRLPLWNPFVGLGGPFLADTESAVFYPPNLLYLALDTHLALFCLTALHLLLAAVGVVKLCLHFGLERALGHAAAFCFLASAPVAGAVLVGQVGHLQAACYLPLLFLLAARVQDGPSRRRLAQLAAGLALQFLCGHPQAAWMTWLALGCFLLGRNAQGGLVAGAAARARDLALLALALAWAGALCSVQLLPFLEMVGQGNRSPSMGFASSGSMAWLDWTSLVFPVRGESPVYWAFSGYVGLACLVGGLAGLTLRDRNARGLAAAAVLAALVAMGDRTPAFPVLYSLVPGLGGFRAHSRLNVVIALALVLGAALWVGSPRRPPRARAVPILAAGAMALVLLLAWSRHPVAGPEPMWAAALVRASGIVVAAALLHRLQGRRPAVAAGWLLGFLILLDLGLAVSALKQAYGVVIDVSGEKAVVQALARARLFSPEGTPPRVSAPYWVARANSGMLHKYANFSSYRALTPQRVWGYLHLSLGLPTPDLVSTFPSDEIYRFGPFPYRSMNLVLGFDPVSSRLVVNPDPDPRAYLAHQALAVRGWRDAVARMKDGHDFHRVALVEGGSDWSAGGSASRDRVRITAFAPERVVLETESDAPALAVVAEAWYPGWTAQVDGSEAPCVPVNAWMRAVPVPAGPHRVSLEFRSTWLRSGALVSALGALFLGWALRGSREARRGPVELQ